MSKARTWELRQDDVKGKRCQLACKPGSVWLRRTGTWQPFIWDDACTSPRATHPDDWPGNQAVGACAPHVIPIRSCSRWGLPCRPCRQRRGGLLPHPFTLTPPALPLDWERDSRRGGILSVALSLGSPPPDVIRHRVSVEPGLSSPHRLSALVKRGCPANWPPPDNGVGNATPEETAAAGHLRNAASKSTP
nr:hypothetical protein RKHAN_01262 [Rhizobium sp. Khangiran2]